MSFDRRGWLFSTEKASLNPLWSGACLSTARKRNRLGGAIVLIPFGAGHVFRRRGVRRSAQEEQVLIPFGAGHVFRPAQRRGFPRRVEVLIPFGAGHVFRRRRTCGIGSTRTRLNPLWSGACLSTEPR